MKRQEAEELRLKEEAEKKVKEEEEKLKSIEDKNEVKIEDVQPLDTKENGTYSESKLVSLILLSD